MAAALPRAAADVSRGLLPGRAAAFDFAAVPGDAPPGAKGVAFLGVGITVT